MIIPEQQRNEVLAEISKATALLPGSMAPVLVANGVTNIGYAIRGARDGTGIAAVSGGFIVQDNSARAAGACGFGADASLTAIILTAAKFDPEMRSAATIRFTDEAGRILACMFLECCAVVRRGKAPGIGTIDWGIASCCKDGVPEAIIDRGLPDALPRIHLFGEKPGEVAANIIMLSNRIIHIEL